jgi:hypothetical protein
MWLIDRFQAWRDSRSSALLGQATLYLVHGLKDIEHQRARERKIHDETGVHVWMDVTTSADTEIKLLCSFCSASESVPYLTLKGLRTMPGDTEYHH